MKEQILSNYTETAKTAMYQFYGSKPYMTAPTIDEEDHVINIARSVMLHRDGIMLGGGFVTAVIENDLEKAISVADSTCSQHLPFFAYCKRGVFIS